MAVDQLSRSAFGNALGAAGGLCSTWGPIAGSMALGQRKSHILKMSCGLVLQNSELFVAACL